MRSYQSSAKRSGESVTAHFEVPLGRDAVSRSMAAKRAVDVIVSTVGLVLLFPVLALIALAVWLEDGGPVFYRQTRVGRAGRPFAINKFRSMRVAASGAGSNLTVSGDQRVTRVGAVLRHAKLDELPQLMNVLKGEMSLVGPRPETPDLIVHYAPAQRAMMLCIPPGITDYASVVLRDESALLARAPDPGRLYRERLMPLKYELCVHYISEIGPFTDARIVLATLWSIVFPNRRNPFIGPMMAGHIEGVLGIDDVA
jgi:lipopolysaccharide/colanic/teichoic acid biosynthesis glycosyltransferase